MTQLYEGFLPGRHQLDGYGAGGFAFAGMSHRGSILILPSGIHAWRVETPQEISSSSLAALFAEPQGAVELLLIGTGTDLVPLPPLVKTKLTQAGIRSDVMATGPAARTFNVLMAENRRVAAALIAVP